MYACFYIGAKYKDILSYLYFKFFCFFLVCRCHSRELVGYFWLMLPKWKISTQNMLLITPVLYLYLPNIGKEGYNTSECLCYCYCELNFSSLGQALRVFWVPPPHFHHTHTYWEPIPVKNSFVTFRIWWRFWLRYGLTISNSGVSRIEAVLLGRVWCDSY